MPEYRFLVPLGACLVLLACSASSDDATQIRDTIAEMETALEAGEARHFVSFLVPDFKGESGINDRASARAFVARQLLSQQKIRVQLGPVSVRLDEGNPYYASADFDALLLGGPRLVPDSGSAYGVETRWRKEQGEWLLVSAAWTRH